MRKFDLLKRFYARFKPQQQRFMAAIHAHITASQREEYAWLMLNRLLFLFFLQQKNLLDRDSQYLCNRLREAQAGQENTFYHSFLLPFFHEALAQSTATRELPFRFGNVPALQLPLFGPHQLEQDPSTISIDDEAFINLFCFLNEYQWRLDAGSAAYTEYDLSPAILGYLFEQQINQKQMGAYYTSDDVTLYVARNTIIPYFLHTLLTPSPEYSSSSLHVSARLLLQQCLQAAPECYIQDALQTPAYLHHETEREYQQRRMRHRQLYTRLRTGAITDVGELITHNLKLEQIAIDMIVTASQAEIVARSYHILTHMTILDPTCGTGAFLLASLRVLQPLYTACLSRLHANTEQCASDSTAIILHHNLYGIDIMAGAVEICRQQLQLAFLANCDETTCNQHPLPDLNHTIRQGDVLSEQLAHTFPAVSAMGGFAILIGNPPYIEYRHTQAQETMQITARDTDHSLSYGYKKFKQGNMYAEVVACGLSLCHQQHSFLGLLLPISLCTSVRFAALREHITQHTSRQWLANFEIFPCRLFEGAYQRLTLLLAQHSSDETGETTVTSETMHVTRLQRWYSAERSHLIAIMLYTQAHRRVRPDLFPKLASPIHEHILEKVQTRAQQSTLAHMLCPTPTDSAVYYQEATNYWMKATRHIPLHRKNGVTMPPVHGRFLYCSDALRADCVMALLNSGLFYLWFATFSDGFHLSHTLVTQFPTGNGLHQLPQLARLAQQLETDIRRHAQLAPRNTRYGDSIEIEEYRMVHSKPLIDQIDSVLACYYGLNAEELDVIVNYDIKYRAGAPSRRE